MVALVHIVFNTLSIFFADRLGRCVLLYVSGAIMGFSLVSYGLYDYLVTKADPVRINLLPMALISLVINRIGFAIGWGPIPMVIMSEICPVRVRGLSIGIASFMSWLSSFIVTNQFRHLEASITVHWVFWFFAGASFFGMVFVAIFLPETNNRSLEQIERHFCRNSVDEVKPLRPDLSTKTTKS